MSTDELKGAVGPSGANGIQGNTGATGSTGAQGPELQSRLDLVCEFQLLNKKDKIKYMEYQLNIFLEKLKIDGDLTKLSLQDMTYIKNINIDTTDDLRDIKRIIRERVLNKINK